MLLINTILILSWSCTILPVAGSGSASDMGPVAFLWPPDRVWGADADNTAPCGSVSGVVNRTQFPLTNGKLALVIQEESWNVDVSISYSSNPTTNDDFTNVISPTRIAEVDDGHQCYVVPNPSSTVVAGMNATFQIKYTSEFDSNDNQTFYACADITYVLENEFKTQIPCFNATISSAPSATSGASSSSATVGTTTTSSNLSGGAIAGIVVGVVGGVSLILIGFLLYWRTLQQKRRLQQQSASMRTVKFDKDAASAGSTSDNPDSNIALQDLR